MSQSPVVSVIIPAFNSARYLPRALDSALGQTYSPAEVIVVDDGSTDDTLGVLAPYRDRIRYVRQANRKLPGARNTGIRQARGELIAFLDADDWWWPDKLERQAVLFRERPQVGVVHSGFVFYDESIDQYLPSDHFHPVLAHELVGNCYVRLIDGNAINVCTAVVRRECFEKVGLFNESLVWGLEDYDLWFRIARYYEFAYVPQVLAAYRRHGANMSSHRLRMDLAELAISCRALAADPELGRAAGKERVNKKLFYLYSEIGRQFFEAGNLPTARHYFSLALQWCPPSRPVWHESWAVGRLYYEKQLYPEANRFFARAVAQRRSRPYFWALWFATLLPFPVGVYWRGLMRQWHRLLGRGDSQPTDPRSGGSTAKGSLPLAPAGSPAGPSRNGQLATPERMSP
jgi:glycosyltransferase involved in cell wall biosynthesis